MGDKEYKMMFGKSRSEAISETQEELRTAIKKRDKAKIKVLFGKLKKVFVGDDVLYTNEIVANMMVSNVLIMLIVLLAVTVGLALLGVYNFGVYKILKFCIICALLMLTGVILCTVKKGEAKWLKYVLMPIVSVVIMSFNVLLGYRIYISLALPVILAVRYFDEKLTRIIAWITGIFLLTTTVGYAFTGVSFDVNNLTIGAGYTIATNGGFIDETIKAAVDAGTIQIVTMDYVKTMLIHSYLPNVMQFLIISIVCIRISKWGHRTIIEQKDVAKEFTRIDTELTLANNIQTNMLPNIFPAFPDRPEFDIYATMTPAKEVGGDFYDFFLVDDDHLGIVISDVSGKGVPAALFMMIGKTLIKNQAQLGLAPAEILEKVNNQLCENNTEQLFITSWVGVLTISTGVLRAANAGHEFPIIKHGDGSYEYLKDRHGFVLAGMEGSKYKEYEIQLNPGDRLFVYTDGVTEATNADNQLFGMDRLRDTLNEFGGVDQKELLTHVHEKIDEFVGEAPQFDDITMVGFRYIGPAEKTGEQA